ncbi:hypothetical protein Shyhy02_54940 [Streptomyces hygroscopicus subsp. hygroscopicus]|nr:hypothetical protein Shyhy02_54940 [Streptomyces hygroscopicus subsp. hygroscopicus]
MRASGYGRDRVNGACERGVRKGPVSSRVDGMGPFRPRGMARKGCSPWHPGEATSLGSMGVAAPTIAETEGDYQANPR